MALGVLLFLGIFILPYVFIARLFSRTRELQDRLAAVERGIAFPVAPRPEPAPRPAPPSPPPVVLAPSVPKPEPRPEPVTAASKLEQMAAASGGLEELIGGNLLNKLGALVLVIGIALFLSYSFTVMSPAGRAFTALGVSVATLAAGVFIETKDPYRSFARGILAAGWAGLYVTTYAMHALPAAQIIESPVLGTLLMLVVAAGMVAHSLKYRVQSLTALSFGCIFAALALSDMNTFVAVSLIPIAVAMLYLARRFDWHELAIFAAIGTYGVFLTRPATGAPLFSIQTMLVIFWVLFEAFDLLRLHSKAATVNLQHALFAVNAVAGLGASAALWQRMAPDSMWMFAAGASVLYLASTWIRFTITDIAESDYAPALILSALLGGLAIFARVPGLWNSIGLIVEAEVLFLAAHHLRIRVGKVLSWLGFAAALATMQWSGPSVSILHAFDVRAFTPALVILAGVFYWNRSFEKEESYWSYFASAFITLVCAVESTTPDWIGFVWLTWAAALYELGLRTQRPEFRVQAYVIGALSTLEMTAAALYGQPPAWTMGVAAAAYYMQAFRMDRETTELRAGSNALASYFVLITLWLAVPASFLPVSYAALALATIEAGLMQDDIRMVFIGRAITAIATAALLFNIPQDAIQRVLIDSTVAATQLWVRFRARRQPLSASHGVAAALIIAAMLFHEVSGGMLTLSWSLEGIALLAIGFTARDRWLRLPGLALLLACIAKVFFYDLRNLDTFYRILSFIGLGVILLAVSWVYTRFKQQLSKLL